MFAVGCDAWLFLLLAISPQTSQLSVNSCAIDQSVTPFLGWRRVCLLQKSQQSVFSRLVSVIITSLFAIALDEIRTRQILREKADCKQSMSRLTLYECVVNVCIHRYLLIRKWTYEGLLFTVKIKGPRIEPCGTPQWRNIYDDGTIDDQNHRYYTLKDPWSFERRIAWYIESFFKV